MHVAIYLVGWFAKLMHNVKPSAVLTFGTIFQVDFAKLIAQRVQEQIPFFFHENDRQAWIVKHCDLT
jgi:hypothetical protein